MMNTNVSETDHVASLTCQAQSRNSRNTGDSCRNLELANADFAQRSPNGWPACNHSRSNNASNLQRQWVSSIGWSGNHHNIQSLHVLLI